MNKQLLHNKKFLIVLFLILSVVVLATAQWITSRQDIRNRAAQTVRLFISPATTQSNPLVVKKGETVTLKLMVNPGQAYVSFIRFQIQYEPDKLAVSTDSGLQINSSVFPTTLDAPVYASGSAGAAISIGADPLKAVTTETQFATITFTALQTTTVPTKVSYVEGQNNPLVLSVGPNEQASENALQSVEPGYLSIVDGPVTSPSPTISVSPSPSGSPSATPTAKVTLILQLLLHGIGSAGDNANLNANSLSNKNPIHQERQLNIQIVNNDNEVVATKIAPAFYNAESGMFFSNVGIVENLPTGDYVVKVKTDRYLRKLMPGFFTIEPGKKTTLPIAQMVAGDVNGDNLLNILDYGILFDCGYGAINPRPMVDPTSIFQTGRNCQTHATKDLADLNDNGVVEETDYNLFIREISVQFGE